MKNSQHAAAMESKYRGTKSPRLNRLRPDREVRVVFRRGVPNVEILQLRERGAPSELKIFRSSRRYDLPVPLLLRVYPCLSGRARYDIAFQNNSVRATFSERQFLAALTLARWRSKGGRLFRQISERNCDDVRSNFIEKLARWNDELAMSNIDSELAPRIQASINALTGFFATHDFEKLGLIHGDFHLGNFIQTDKRRGILIDFEYCSFGEPHYDLAKLGLVSDLTIEKNVKFLRIFGFSKDEHHFHTMKMYRLYHAVGILLWSARHDAKEDGMWSRAVSEIEVANDRENGYVN